MGTDHIGSELNVMTELEIMSAKVRLGNWNCGKSRKFAHRTSQRKEMAARLTAPALPQVGKCFCVKESSGFDRLQSDYFESSDARGLASGPV